LKTSTPLLVLVAGCGITPEPYEMIAAANLSGTAGIDGPLELLATGAAAPATGGAHTLAAYRIHLPDLAPRRVRLFRPASCDTPHADVTLTHDLGTIRRVGNETHFFAPASIAGRIIDVDIMTATAFVTLDDPEAREFYALGMIAVVQDVVDDEPAPDPGQPGSGPTGSGPGPWLACGAFQIP
jgi:hypothetical protein